MNEVAVGRGHFLDLRNNVDVVDPLVIGGWLLADEPFQVGCIQVLTTLVDGRTDPFGGLASVLSHGHVVFTEMIEDPDQLDLVAPVGDLLDGLFHEGDEAGVDVAGFCDAALRRPIVDLCATVRELGDSDVAGQPGRQCPAKAELRAERVVVSGRPQGLP